MEFAPFYQAHAHVIRAEMYGYTGDLRVATDVTREAFARALARWSKMGTVGDPLRWTRAAAFELATAHVNKATAGGLPAARGPAGGLPAARGPAAAALGRLPSFERRLVILHHLSWMSAADIAAFDGVDEGRVRFWLEDARTSLAGVAQSFAVAGDPVAGLLAAVREESDAPPRWRTSVRCPPWWPAAGQRG